MVDDDDAVARKMHVEFKAVRAGRQPAIERGDCILGRQRTAASMSENLGTARHEERV